MDGKKYSVKSQHYGKQPQVMDTFDDEAAATHYLEQQAAIIRGYAKRTGFLDGQFIVFGKGDIFKTRLWVAAQ